MKILIVDDDENIRGGLRRNLAWELGADVTEAADGQAALERLMRHDYDVVLLDLQMPQLDGITTMQAVRRSPRLFSLPIIVLSGHSDESLVRRAIALGASDFLVKPVDKEVLFKRLESSAPLAFSKLRRRR